MLEAYLPWILMALLLLWALIKLRNLERVVDSHLRSISAPAAVLTEAASSLQQQIGSLHQSITLMSTSITEITKQATRIEEIGKKYEEAEELTRRMYNIMIGSYEKGRSGENYLRSVMNELMKIGFVRQNVPIERRMVEYCVVFNDGKLLAIDSKVVATRDVEALFDEEVSEEERARRRSRIVAGLRRKVEEVSRYIVPGVTLPCAVMAVPDSIVDLTSEVVPEAVRRNVIIAGYSAIPQLLVYFLRVHSFYSIREDMAELLERITAIRQELSKLDDRFFANRFERPLRTLSNALFTLQGILRGVNRLLALEMPVAEEEAEAP
ncbi:MAG: recombinase RmuC [Candidatus Bathyarchaeota archaeon B23]|nr:MAG: recombinase RmuC [Candidatus Bathyarchaeota archaeon B23]